MVSNNEHYHGRETTPCHLIHFQDEEPDRRCVPLTCPNDHSPIFDHSYYYEYNYEK